MQTISLKKQYQSNPEFRKIVSELNDQIKPNKKYLIANIGDGLGSRMRKTGNLIAVSESMDATPIIIWVENDAIGNLKSLDQVIDIHYPKLIMIKVQSNFKRKILFCENVQKTKKSTTVQDLNKPVTFITDNLHMHWLMTSEQRITADNIIKKFEPQSYLKDRIEEYASKNFRGKVLGIHVRSGDLRRYVQRRFYDIEKYQHVIKNLKKYDTIFACCEDRDHLQKLKQNFPNVVHVNKALNDPNSTAIYARNEIEKAVIEMFLMCKCHTLLGAQSNFTHLPKCSGVPFINVKNPPTISHL